MKKISKVLISAILSLSMCCLPLYAEEIETEEIVEENNTIEKTEEIVEEENEEDNTIPVLIENMNKPYTITSTERYFSFTPNHDAEIFISGISDSHTYGTLYDASYTELAKDENNKNLGYFLLSYKMSANTTYIIGVHLSEEEPDSSIQFNIFEHYTLPYGTCGKNINWTLNEGVLTITGSGKMDSFEDGGPWWEYSSYIREVVIDEGITNIGSEAFFNCRFLEKITLPSTITDIGGMAFCECESLTSICIPEGVTSIGTSTFEDCKNLSTIIAPDSLEQIGYYAFCNCSSLTTIHLTDSLKYIDEEAFGGCSKLNNIYLSDSITYIGEGAFSSCHSLRDVTISESLIKKIDLLDVFKGCPFILNYIDGESDGSVSWTLKNHVLTVSGSGTLDSNFYWLQAEIEKVVFLGSITSIGESFYGCINLKSIEIPDGVTAIESDAFGECKSLESIILPNGLKSIGESAFYSCTNLSSITLPDTVTTIGANAFYGCTSLKSINIPKSVRKIEKNAFDKCSLSTIYVYKNSYGDSFFKSNKQYLDNVVIEESLLQGYSLNVSGQVYIRFYMTLSDDVLKDEDAYMMFTMNGHSLKTPVSSGKKTFVSSIPHYIFSYPLSFKDLTSPIRIQLISKYGTGKTYTYSAEYYARYIMGHPSSFSDEARTVVKAMLTYGYYCQQYFNYRTDALPYLKNSLDSVSFSPYKLQPSNDVEFLGSRLLLKSNLGLKLYFKGDGDFYVDGKKVNTTNENDLQVITINSIKDINHMYSITCKDMNLSYSVASYGYSVMHGNNTSLKNLMKAIVAYYNLFSE